PPARTAPAPGARWTPGRSRTRQRRPAENDSRYEPFVYARLRLVFSETMAGPSYRLLYGRDCGICSAPSRWIRAVDVRRRIRFESIQSGRGLLKGIPADRMLDAWHMVAPDGQVPP